MKLSELNRNGVHDRFVLGLLSSVSANFCPRIPDVAASCSHLVPESVQVQASQSSCSSSQVVSVSTRGCLEKPSSFSACIKLEINAFHHHLPLPTMDYSAVFCMVKHQTIENDQ